MKSSSFKHYMIPALAGLAAALTAVIYRAALESAEWVLQTVINAQKTTPYIAILWFIILIVMAFMVWKIILWNPDISGGGMAHMLAVCEHDVPNKWSRNLAGNLTGGTISLMGGLSIGNESPVVQMGASAANGVAHTFGIIEREPKRKLIELGAATGFAVGFSAPISGLFFARWLTGKSRNVKFYILIASVTAVAYAVIMFFYGVRPYFKLETASLQTPIYLLLASLLGVLCGFLGMLFNFLMMKIQFFFDRFTVRDINKFIIILSLFMIAGTLTFVFPETVGSGAYLVPILDTPLPIKFLATALIVKFVFTLVSPTGGVPGGMLYPVLAIGALTGKLFGELIAAAGIIPMEFTTAFILAGMAAIFCSSLRMPWIGGCLVLELTWQFHSLPVVAASVFFSYLTIHLFKSKGLYDMLETRLLARYIRIKSEQSMPLNLAECVETLNGYREAKKINDART